MPTTIIDADLVHATVGEGRLVLHYTGRVHPPAYFLIHREADGREVEREGPFVDEDTALDAATRRHGALDWQVG